MTSAERLLLRDHAMRRHDPSESTDGSLSNTPVESNVVGLPAHLTNHLGQLMGMSRRRWNQEAGIQRKS